MHSLPSERNRGNGEKKRKNLANEFYCTVWRERKGGRVEGGRRKGRGKVVLSVVDILDNVYFGEAVTYPGQENFLLFSKCVLQIL